MKDNANDLAAALEKCLRVLSHVSDTPLADPLKYVPRSAYNEAIDQARAVLAQHKKSAATRHLESAWTLGAGALQPKDSVDTQSSQE